MDRAAFDEAARAVAEAVATAAHFDDKDDEIAKTATEAAMEAIAEHRKRYPR